MAKKKSKKIRKDLYKVQKHFCCMIYYIDWARERGDIELIVAVADDKKGISSTADQ